MSWSVDSSCIDCDACVQHAPSVFEHEDGRAIIAKQPDPTEVIGATRALLACPVGAIKGDVVRGVWFPQHLGDTARSAISICGFNHEDAFGGNAFLVERAGRNLLIDGPRYAQPLVRAMKSIAHVLITHADDVGDAEQWAARSSARVWIHERDAHAAPFATDLIRGDDPIAIDDGVIAIPVPGHTRGSVMFLVDDDALFTGDSLYWSRTRARLSAFRDATWFSWERQIDSLARLVREHRFGWILAGHGDRKRLDPDTAHAQVLDLIARMRDAPDGEGDW